MAQEQFPTGKDTARIQLMAKDIGSRIATRESLRGNRLPFNCPFVFYDGNSGHFIVGDAFFQDSPRGTIWHKYQDMRAYQDRIDMANHVARTILVILEDGIAMPPLLCDEASKIELENLRGNSIQSDVSDPLHFQLTTPVGVIPLYLPDNSMPFLNLGQDLQQGIGPVDRPLLE